MCVCLDGLSMLSFFLYLDRFIVCECLLLLIFYLSARSVISLIGDRVWLRVGSSICERACLSLCILSLLNEIRCYTSFCYVITVGYSFALNGICPYTEVVCDWPLVKVE